MTMRFFSHDWATFEPEAASIVTEAYLRSIEGFGASVGSSIREFVAREDLRGALLDDLTRDRESASLNLRLVSGDEARGYHHLTVNYSNATVLTPLPCVSKVLDSRRARVRYDEFVACGAGFAHNLLVWPKGFGTLEIVFANLSVSWVKLPRRQYVSYGALGEGLGED